MEPSSPTYRQRIIAIALGAGLLAGVVGGAGSIIGLSYLKVPGVSAPTTTGTSTTTKKVVLEESSAFIDATKKISPSVVSVTATSTAQNFFGQQVQSQSGGSGFILTSDGLIVTNKHVVSDASASYTVVTSDGHSYAGTILSTDPLNDLAVIKINATGLKPVELGDDGKLQVGQWVIAVGNALGEYQNTVTVGVVSAKNRRVSASDATTGASETIENAIQTDAAINPGNSGGPLVNLDGQVVGINTAVASDAQGIGFAIGIDSVKTALQSVLQSGKIIRPYLGVRYTDITPDVAQLQNLPVSQGALVYPGSSANEPAVVSGSPADKAGIKQGDIITQLNGQAIDANNSLISRLENYKPGDTITLTINRAGKTMSVKVTLGTSS